MKLEEMLEKIYELRKIVTSKDNKETDISIVFRMLEVAYDALENHIWLTGDEEYFKVFDHIHAAKIELMKI